MGVKDKQRQYSEELLKDLGFADSSVEEQQQALEVISNRFNDVIIFTLVELIDDKHRKKFIEALNSPSEIDDQIELIAAEIPGLAEKLEIALAEEYEAIKSAMQK